MSGSQCPVFRARSSMLCSHKPTSTFRKKPYFFSSLPFASLEFSVARTFARKRFLRFPVPDRFVFAPGSSARGRSCFLGFAAATWNFIFSFALSQQWFSLPDFRSREQHFLGVPAGRKIVFAGWGSCSPFSSVSHVNHFLRFVESLIDAWTTSNTRKCVEKVRAPENVAPHDRANANEAA